MWLFIRTSSYENPTRLRNRVGRNKRNFVNTLVFMKVSIQKFERFCGKGPRVFEEIKAEFLAESGAIDQRVSMQNTLVAIPKEGRADILQFGNVIGHF